MFPIWFQEFLTSKLKLLNGACAVGFPAAPTLADHWQLHCFGAEQAIAKVCLSATAISHCGIVLAVLALYAKNFGRSWFLVDIDSSG